MTSFFFCIKGELAFLFFLFFPGGGGEGFGFIVVSAAVVVVDFVVVNLKWELYHPVILYSSPQ